MEYIPKTLDEFVGNERLKKFLRGMSFKKPVMFEGLPGTGKTSLAHILSNMFGAPPENVTDLNCVYYSKVEDMRERLASLSRSSLFGAKKVLILDEIHELSDKTQQVLLKPLEVLSEGIFVLACTTTTQKVIPTLLRRFDRFKLEALTDEESEELIKKVSNTFDIHLNDELKNFLIKESKGIPNTIIRGVELLDKAESIEDALYILHTDSLEDTDVLALMKLIIKRAKWSILKTELEILLKSYSPSNVRTGLLNLIAARLISPYFKSDKEGDFLSKCFSILSRDGIPEKAFLIVAIYNISRLE